MQTTTQKLVERKFFVWFIYLFFRRFVYIGTFGQAEQTTGYVRTDTTSTSPYRTASTNRQIEAISRGCCLKIAPRTSTALSFDPISRKHCFFNVKK